jgi:SAM-dependent methyltransferase
MTNCKKKLINKCENCNSTQFINITESFDYEYETTSDIFNFVECQNCNLVFLHERPLNSELDLIYPKNYIPYNFKNHLGGIINHLRNMVQKKKIKPFLKYADKNSTILDIGFGSGELLMLLQKFGCKNWSLWGVDMSNEAVKKIKSKGINAICSNIDNLSWPRETPKPNIIIMNQVIEHLNDPALVINKCHQLLDEDGILIVETPSTNAWDFQIFKKKYWGGYHTPRHWNLFNETSLSFILKNNNFQIVKINNLLSPNFWLQSIHHLIKYKYRLTKIAEYFDVKNIFFLSIFSLIDYVQIKLFNKSSNLRVIAKKT